MNAKSRALFEEYASRDDWYIKTFHSRVLAFFAQVNSAYESLTAFPFAQRYAGLVMDSSNQLTWFWNASEMLRTRQEFISRVESGSDFLDSFERDFLGAWETYLVADRRFVDLDLETLSAEELVTEMQNLMLAESPVGKLGYLNDCFLSTGGEDWIVEKINTELPKDVEGRDEIIATLATPIEHSFVQEEELSRMEIAAAPVERRGELLAAHAAAWHWVENSYFYSDPLTVKDFAVKVDALIDSGDDVDALLLQASKVSDEKSARKEEIMNQFNFSEKLRRVIDLSERISHITDLRKQGALRVSGQIWRWLPEAEKRSGQPRELLLWMMPDEMEAVIVRGDTSAVTERQKGFAAFWNHETSSPVFFSATDLISLDLSPFMGVDETVTTLKGQVAFVGHVTGTARVIQGRHDFDRFQDGDVLVTNQTTPEFVPLVRRASAVVTDQGGITCHAAIVSRELEIPCIIGTDVATRVIKDGEQISVDASSGTVQRIDL